MIQLLCMLISVSGTFGALMAFFSNYVNNNFYSNIFMWLSSGALVLMLAFLVNIVLYLIKAVLFDKKLKINMSKMSTEEARLTVENFSDYEIQLTIKSLLSTLLTLKLPEKRIATMVFNDVKACNN